MIDVHCHPLAGVDDGAESFEVSVEMCRMAAADGVTHLVATPHCNYAYPFDPELIRRKIEELQAAVGDKPEILPGCDFHLSYDNVQKCAQSPKLYTINRGMYLLVELSDHFIPQQMDQVLYNIQVAGLVPIITHPERNMVCQRKPELLEHWVQRGCLAQITAQSYTGDFGGEVQRLSNDWVSRNLVHCLASDAHDVKHRPPILSKSYRKVVEAQGEEAADRLLKRNPEAIIQSKPMPPQPPPVEAQPPNRTRRWFSFLRG